MLEEILNRIINEDMAKGDSMNQKQEKDKPTTEEELIGDEDVETEKDDDDDDEISEDEGAELDEDEN